MNKLFLTTYLVWIGMNVSAQILETAAPVEQTQSQKASTRITQELENGHIIYSYCPANATVTQNNGIGYNTTEDISITAAIGFGQGWLSRMTGKHIYRIRIGTAADTDAATIFIRSTLGGNNQWSTQIPLKLGWNDVTLETPFVINDISELYIGYSCIQKNRQYVIATGRDTYKNGGCYIATDNDTPEAVSSLGNLCIQVELDANAEEFHNIGSLVSATTSNPYFVKGETINTDITLLNESENSISNITLGRSFNGTAISDTICTLSKSIKSLSTGSITLTMTPPTSGEYIFTLKEIEGTPISVSPIGSSVAAYDAGQAFSRMVLMEEFTSQYCGNCPSGQRSLHAVINGYEDRTALVLHHSGYTPDIFSVLESWNYCYFYNSSSIYAPAMMMDRTCFPKYISTANSPVFHPGYLQKASFLAELATPAMVSVNMISSYNEATRELKVTVSGRKITELIGNHIGLNLFLLESGYTAYQSGDGYNFEHNNFLRAIISEDWQGDAITFETDGSYTRSYTYIIPATYTAYGFTGEDATNNAHPEKMSLVAFVANYDYKNTALCTVLNAAKSSLNDNYSTPTITGIENSAITTAPCIAYAANSNICITGEYSSLKVFTLYGMEVGNHSLTPGIYLVEIKDAAHHTSIQKVVVK